MQFIGGGITPFGQLSGSFGPMPGMSRKERPSSRRTMGITRKIPFGLLISLTSLPQSNVGRYQASGEVDRFFDRLLGARQSRRASQSPQPFP